MSYNDKLFLGIDGGGTKTEFLLVDESGKELPDPLTGDNDDYYMTINGQEKMLSQYFKELNEYSASAEEKKEKEEDQRMKNEQS